MLDSITSNDTRKISFSCLKNSASGADIYKRLATRHFLKTSDCQKSSNEATGGWNDRLSYKASFPDEIIAHKAEARFKTIKVPLSGENHRVIQISDKKRTEAASQLKCPVHFIQSRLRYVYGRWKKMDVRGGCITIRPKAGEIETLLCFKSTPWSMIDQASEQSVFRSVSRHLSVMQARL